MKKSRKRALRYSREKIESMEFEGTKLRAEIPWTLGSDESFSKGIENTLVGKTTPNGWTVVDAKRKSDSEIVLTVVNY